MKRLKFFVQNLLVQLLVCLLSQATWGGLRKMSEKKTLGPKQVQAVFTEFEYKKHELTLDQFAKKMKEKNLVILDLRDETQFKRGHLKNAVAFGADASEENLKKAIPNFESTVLIYCTNSFSPSRMISLTLSVTPQIYHLGYKNVYYLSDFAGSIEEAKAKGIWSEGK